MPNASPAPSVLLLAGPGPDVPAAPKPNGFKPELAGPWEVKGERLVPWDPKAPAGGVGAEIVELGLLPDPSPARVGAENPMMGVGPGWGTAWLPVLRLPNGNAPGEASEPETDEPNVAEPACC